MTLKASLFIFLCVVNAGCAWQNLTPKQQTQKRKCDKGDLLECVSLGVWLSVGGMGGTVDKKGARHLFNKVCSQGQMIGCTALGNEMIESAVPGEPKRARLLYERACKGGYALGCAALALAWKNGNGGPTNKVKTAHYYRRACQLNGNMLHTEFCVKAKRAEEDAVH